MNKVRDTFVNQHRDAVCTVMDIAACALGATDYRFECAVPHESHFMHMHMHMH